MKIIRVSKQNKLYGQNNIHWDKWVKYIEILSLFYVGEHATCVRILYDMCHK